MNTSLWLHNSNINKKKEIGRYSEECFTSVCQDDLGLKSKATKFWQEINEPLCLICIESSSFAVFSQAFQSLCIFLTYPLWVCIGVALFSPSTRTLRRSVRRRTQRLGLFYVSIFKHIQWARGSLRISQNRGKKTPDGSLVSSSEAVVRIVSVIIIPAFKARLRLFSNLQEEPQRSLWRNAPPTPPSLRAALRPLRAAVTPR